MKRFFIALFLFSTALSAFANETTPTMLTATSVTVAAARPTRRYLQIQNNSAANILCSLVGNVLTGIVPTSTNKGIVLAAGGRYEMPYPYIYTGAITCYQTSGGTINTVVIEEG